jgi:hypothetical protein
MSGHRRLVGCACKKPLVISLATRPNVPLHRLIFGSPPLLLKTGSRFMSPNLTLPQPIFMKLGMCLTTLGPISAACSTNPSHQSVYIHIYTYPARVAKQHYSGYEYRSDNRRIEDCHLLRCHVVHNTAILHSYRRENLKPYITQALSGAYFSPRSVSYQRK